MSTQTQPSLAFLISFVVELQVLAGFVYQSMELVISTVIRVLVVELQVLVGFVCQWVEFVIRVLVVKLQVSVSSVIFLV